MDYVKLEKHHNTLKDNFNVNIITIKYNLTNLLYIIQYGKKKHSSRMVYRFKGVLRR